MAEKLIEELEWPERVEEQRCAEWVFDETSSDINCDYYICSRCGRRTRVQAGTDVAMAKPYCHCGARMTGESK